MAVNKQFYGENGMRVFTGSNLSNYTRYVQGMRCANFNDASSPNETSGRLTTAAAQGITEVGAMPDLSICTHGIAAGGQWNTLWDSGGFDNVGRPGDNMYKPNKGPTMPVSWLFHQLNDMSYSQGYCSRRITLDNVFWGPNKVEPRDGLSAQMITEMDFKGIIAIPIVQVSNNAVQSERDTYGRYVLDGSWKTSYWLSLDEYVNGSYTGGDSQTYYWWDQYPMVHGIGYIVYRTNLVDNNNQWTIISPTYDWVRNNVTAFPLEMGRWSCDASLTLPSDGSIKTTGIDFCSPVQAANGITVRIKYDLDAERRSQNYSFSPTGGNIPLILGGSVNNSGFRQRNGFGDFYEGVSFVRGFSHLNTIAIANTDNQFYIWDDKPTSKDDFVEAVHTMMSYLCIPFADDLDLIDTTRPKYIGILDDNNLATGRYEIIENLDDYVQLATDDFIDNTTYDPTYKPDDPYADAAQSQIPLDKTDVWNWTANTQLVGYAYARSANVYLCSPDMVGTIRYKISQLPSANSETSTFPYFNPEKWANICGTSIFDSVLSVKCIPIRGLDQWTAVGNEITSQTLIPDVAAINGISIFKPLLTTTTLDMGSIDLKITQGWELEYTNFEIFLPYAGSYPIQIDSPSALHLYCNVDIITGDIQYYLVQDGNVIFSTGGNCGIDMPFNLAQAQMHYNKQAYKQNLITNGLATAGKIVGAALTGGVGGTLLSGAIDTVKDQFTLTPHNVQSCPAVGAGCASGGPLVAYVLAKVPVMHERGFGYGQAIGTDKKHLATSIGSESGYVLTENYKATSIICTEDEKREIERLMDSGVFI